MVTICANCKNSQGPFYNFYLFSERFSVCKNTKKHSDRVTNCVEKRSSIDTAKYKELLHVYE